MSTQWQLEGMNQLLSRINAMGKQVSTEVRKEALTQGAEIIRDAAKERFDGGGHPKNLTGNLQEHIIISDVKNGEILIGPDQQGDAFYGYFLEFGRQAGVRKWGANKGFAYPDMPAYPFMQPAFEENQGRVIDIMASKVREALGL